MRLASVPVPHVGEQPNPLFPVWAEILVQLLLLAILVAVVVFVVRLVVRRTRPVSGAAGVDEGLGSLTHEQAYEAAYRFIVDRSRAGDSVADLAASMQPIRDVYEDQSTDVRAAWQRAVEETTRSDPLPRP
ncbi:hypothetical protein KLP28_14050 [Nocardioidaceae bacterium]|nr:hypothetical protein KLP28_14050 [Nocardioidaceae bacterium]